MTSVHAALNEAQRQAVQVPGGAVLILAGPGSGKTRVIAHRIAYLVDELGVPPYRILAVTFTNKAAREMRERVEALLDERAADLAMGTFHAVCARILRRDGQQIGIPTDFVIYDADDQNALVRGIEAELHIDPKRFAPAALRSAISAAKNARIDAAAYATGVGSYFEEIVGRVFERYEQALRASAAVDFDDLLGLVLALFERVPEVRDRYAERYLHLLIDEFQDTNLVQYRLAREIGSRHGNVTAVGDPDQSIYSWRAADVRNLASFQRDFAGARVVLLEQNYRSTGHILRAAHSVIRRAEGRPEKELWTRNPDGQRVVEHEAHSGEDEAIFIAREVQRLMRVEDRRPSDFAVMYRTNAQSRALEEAFVYGGVPYRVVGGTRFYDRREVRDLLAYLRLVHNEADSIAFRRIVNVPGRGIGARTLERLLAASSQLGVPPLAVAARVARGDTESGLPAVRAGIRGALGAFVELIDGLVRQREGLKAAGLLEEMLRAVRYHEYLQESDSAHADARWENAQELLNVARQYEDLEPAASLASFLEEVALVADVDDPSAESPDAVTLTTLHAAKGLEFPVVFLAGLEEGFLPHMRSIDDPAQMEEERRLCYVGMTRAQERLYVSHAASRFHNGSLRRSTRSRFLDDVPAEEIARPAAAVATSGPVGRERRAALAARQEERETPAEPAYAPGDRVMHEQFGRGVVVSCALVPGDQQVTVAFEGRGVKKLLLSFAPLAPAAVNEGA